MLFRRLFLCALFVGLCAGLATSAIQYVSTAPLIAAAEVFESAMEPEAPAEHAHAAGAAAHEHDHHHDASAWEPAEGLERGFWTMVANALGATGFALLLIPALAWWDRQQGGAAASWKSGLLWGLCGWVAVFAWPSLGLHPELPGEVAAGLYPRQAWWLLAVVCAAGGLALLALGGGKRRWLGLPLLALPFVIGAPLPDGSAFARFPAEAAVQMQALHSQFVFATAVTNAVQWLVIGALSGWAVARWLRPLLAEPFGTSLPRGTVRHAG